MATRYAPHAERRERGKEVRAAQTIMGDPILFAQISDKGGFKKTAALEKKVLEQRTPPPLADSERQPLQKRTELLQEAMVHGVPSAGIEPMPSQRQQNDGKAGAVGHCLRWNKFVSHYTIDDKGRLRPVKEGEQPLVDEWKDNRRRLFAEMEEDYQDIASVEVFRPEQTSGSQFINTYKVSYAPGAKLSPEEWNAATGHVPSPAEQAIYAAEATAVPPSPEDLYIPTRLSQRKKNAIRAAQPQCAANTAKGSRCSRRALPGTEYCGLKHR